MTDKIFRYVPLWRKGDRSFEVEVVQQPSALWFSNVQDDGTGRRFVRYAVMDDGAMFFGDGMDVVHWDMCGIRRDKTEPMFCGMLVQIDGEWRLGSAQFFGRGYEEDAMTKMPKLLPSFAEWSRIVESMGNDPCALPPLGIKA